MELVSKLMKKTATSMAAEDEEKKPVRSVTFMEDEEWLDIPKTALRWQRMVTLLGVIMTHSDTGSIIRYMETLRDRIAQEKLKEYVKAAGSSKEVVSKPKPKKDAPKGIPMAKGKALSRSIAVPEVPFIDPWICKHLPEDLSPPRGGMGGLKWFTCLKCGSRWERVWESEPTTTPEQGTKEFTTSLDPNGSTSQEPVPVPNPLAQKRKTMPYTITIPTQDGTTHHVVDHDTMVTYKHMEAIFQSMTATMTEKESVKAMMTMADLPQDVEAVTTFIKMRFWYVDPK